MLRLSLMTSILLSPIAPAVALPPAEDEPEEILRTEIIVEARSPINGEPLTAEEYANLQAQLEAAANTPRELNSRVREIIFLLQLRQGIRTIAPFLLR